ncbi:transglutaminase domain-containing protein [Kitasatospora sp. NPDC006697]|uniref:transglutaminase domain-containing protein n=1 Tax=Kitasatospora sp. NPDC006697 TaxID=3364020 RepID=UPI00368BFC07
MATVHGRTVADGGPDAPRDERVADLVDRVRRVPDGHRSYTESAERAVGVYRIPRDLLDRCLDHGLPHSGTGPELRFDRNDVDNLVIGLGVASPRVNGLRRIGNAFAELAAAGPEELVLEVSARCPEPGHPGGCEFALTMAAGLPAGAAERVGEQQYRIALTRPAVPVRRVELPEPWRAAVEGLADVRFHVLPDALSHDLGFLRESRLADCRLASRHLVAAVRAAGAAARPATGLILVKPFPLYHWWVEALIGGERVAVDPFFLRVLAELEIVDARDWPPDRAMSEVYWFTRSPGEQEAVASLTAHNGVRAREMAILR